MSEKYKLPAIEKMAIKKPIMYANFPLKFSNLVRNVFDTTKPINPATSATCPNRVINEKIV